MTYYRVADFIKPMYAVQSEPGIDDIIVLLMKLAPIDIENNRENKYKSPVKVLSRSYSYTVYEIHGFD